MLISFASQRRQASQNEGQGDGREVMCYWDKYMIAGSWFGGEAKDPKFLGKARKQRVAPPYLHVSDIKPAFGFSDFHEQAHASSVSINRLRITSIGRGSITDAAVHRTFCALSK
jgi:hypothetical protein